MFEKVNGVHPDKIADRIAGAIVDLAYSKQDNPKVAVEVLIGHGECMIINETSQHLEEEEIKSIVARIAEDDLITLKYIERKQDPILAHNQDTIFKCGDNGIFKGCATSKEEQALTELAGLLWNEYKADGKYIYNEEDKTLIVCQSNVETEKLRRYLLNNIPLCKNLKVDSLIINPLGHWTGGLYVDSGATNRKLGSDMGRAVTGGGLCVSGDTEFISEDFKWHKIKDWAGEKVGQWNNGKLEFVNSNHYVHNVNDNFIYFHNDTKLSMMITANHECLVRTSKGNYIKHKAKYLAEKLLAKSTVNMGSIPHFFHYQKSCIKSKYSSEDNYRLQVAFCADGTILTQTHWTGRIRVKKQTKILRLRELLKNIEHKETRDGEFAIFWFCPQVKSKSLYECFADENWDVLYNEVFKWDGDEKRRLFRTTSKQDADFIQFIISSYGKIATINCNDRRGELQKVNGKTYVRKSCCYVVNELHSTYTHLRMNEGKGKITIEQGITRDSYCFNVPSHNLVLRHNNRIFITGNCGKDMSKADISINIYLHIKAELAKMLDKKTNGKHSIETSPLELYCAIGDTTVDGKPYHQIVQIAKKYIDEVGGFEKFAEWGLIRPLEKDVNYKKYARFVYDNEVAKLLN